MNHTWCLIAVLLAPPKVAAPARSAGAIEGDKLFWETFHGGRYEDIQKVLRRIDGGLSEGAERRRNRSSTCGRASYDRARSTKSPDTR